MIEVPDSYVGAVMEKIGARKAELLNMGSRESGTTHMEFKIPARGLMGYRSEFLTDTNGNGIMNQLFAGYEPIRAKFKPASAARSSCMRRGKPRDTACLTHRSAAGCSSARVCRYMRAWSWANALKTKISSVNVCKKKQMTNTRAAGSDDALRLVPPTTMSLEQCMEFIKDDELLEVTPSTLRLRKTILAKDLTHEKAIWQALNPHLHFHRKERYS